MRVEMTSTAFLDAGWEERLAECRNFAEDAGWEFGIQFHNTAPESQISMIARTGVAMSAHAPLAQNRNWNLAAADTEETFRAIGGNVRLFERLGITRSVFHGACMSDAAPEAFGHGKSYFQCMEVLYRPELALSAGSRLNRDFTKTPEFAVRYERLRNNLERMRKEFGSVMFCLENDFPAYGSCNMFPGDMISLGHPICLDTGHLWISARLADLDFHGVIELAMKSGLVRMCHLHGSIWNDSMPKETWRDGHMPLSTPNPKLDLPRAVRIMRDNGLEYFVLEIVHGTIDDLKTLRFWLETP